MKKLFILGCAVFLFGLAIHPGSATAETISATDDVMVGRYKYWPHDYTYYDSEEYFRMSTGSYHSTSSSNYDYYSYLQFDLSDIPDDFDLSSAVLRLYVLDLSTNQSPYVSHISDDSWDESTIHWSNRPATDGQIAAQTDWGYNPSYEWVNIPLINWDYQADLTDDALSIVLTPWSSGNYGPTMYYATQGYSDGSYVATLELIEVEEVPIPEPATMLLLGSGLIGLAGFRKRFRKQN